MVGPDRMSLVDESLAFLRERPTSTAAGTQCQLGQALGHKARYDLAHKLACPGVLPVVRGQLLPDLSCRSADTHLGAQVLPQGESTLPLLSAETLDPLLLSALRRVGLRFLGPMLARTVPADPLQRVVECGTCDLECAAHRRLAGAAVERRHDLVNRFWVDRRWPPSSAPAPSRRGQPRIDPLPDQGPLVLGKRPEEIVEELAMRGRGVDALRQRAERDSPPLQVIQDANEVRERAAEAVELPDHQHITCSQPGKAGLQAGAVVAPTREPVL